jgi:bacillithiol biosynthesis deacetylase BshB1
LKVRALFFGAHPDDAELCCGGTIAKLTAAGEKTGIIDLTMGELGTRGDVSLRKKEAGNAAKVLNVSFRENLKIPDGNIANTPSYRLKVIKVIRKYRPDIIFFPHYFDRHPDHFHTHQLVKESAFYSGLAKIKTGILEPYRPRRNFYYMQTYAFEPSFICDVSDTYSLKMKAIGCYSSQFYDPSYKTDQPGTFISSRDFLEYIEARSRFYGFQIGAKHGEPFSTDEKIKIGIKELFRI